MAQPQQIQISGPFSYVADGLATIHNSDFSHQPNFAQAYNLGMDTIRDFRPDLQIQWRVYTACWAATLALNTPGDFIECGVNTGILSRAIIDYIQFAEKKERTFWLLDTFEGIPEEQLTENEQRMGRAKSNNKYLHGFEKVQSTFASFDNVKLIKGKVPDTLPQVQTEKIAYLSIDMNAVFPEISAANYFWDKLQVGGVMLLDDYGFLAHREQMVAFDQFAKERNAMIYSSPTGQGILVKGAQ